SVYVRQSQGVPGDRIPDRNCCGRLYDGALADDRTGAVCLLFADCDARLGAESEPAGYQRVDVCELLLHHSWRDGAQRSADVADRLWRDDGTELLANELPSEVGSSFFQRC